VWLASVPSVFLTRMARCDPPDHILDAVRYPAESATNLYVLSSLSLTIHMPPGSMTVYTNLSGGLYPDTAD